MKRPLICLPLLLGVFAPSAFAAENPADEIAGAANRSDWMNAAEMQEMERQALQREGASLAPAEKRETKKEPVIEEKTWPVKSVFVEGVTPRELRFVHARAKELEGQSIGAKGLAAFVDGIQEEILSRGYLTTRVTLPEQSLASGELHLVLTAGRIASIRYQDGGHLPGNLFPTSSGHVLNLRDLEQGLDNLRRLSYEEVRMELTPSAEEGMTDVVLLRTRVHSPLHVGLSFDTYSDRYVGRNTLTASATLDNAFGLGDRLFASYSTGDRRHVSEKGKDSVYFRWEVPLGRDLLALSYSGGSDYQSITPYYHLKSNRRTWGISDRHLISRSQTMKWYLDADVSLLSRHSLLESRFNEAADPFELRLLRRHVVQATLGTSFVRYVPGGVMTGALSYVQGLPWMNAEDFETAEGATNRAHYFTLDTSYLTRFHGAPRLRYLGVFHAQYAPQPLLSLSRLSLGGAYTVRGFSGDETVSADNGWYLRNELSYDLGAGWEGYLALDGGRASDVSLIGGGLGIRRVTDDMSIDVFAGAPIHAPDDFDRGLVCQTYLRYSF